MENNKRVIILHVGSFPNRGLLDEVMAELKSHEFQPLIAPIGTANLLYSNWCVPETNCRIYPNHPKKIPIPIRYQTTKGYNNKRLRKRR